MASRTIPIGNLHKDHLLPSFMTGRSFCPVTALRYEFHPSSVSENPLRLWPWPWPCFGVHPGGFRPGGGNQWRCQSRLGGFTRVEYFGRSHGRGHWQRQSHHRRRRDRCQQESPHRERGRSERNRRCQRRLPGGAGGCRQQWRVWGTEPQRLRLDRDPRPEHRHFRDRSGIGSGVWRDGCGSNDRREHQHLQHDQ